MKAADSSCRTWMNRIRSWRWRSASMMPLMPSPGSPKTTSTPQSWMVSISTSAAVCAMVDHLPASLASGGAERVPAAGHASCMGGNSVSGLAWFSLRWKLIASFGLVLALLLGLAVAAHRTTSANRAATGQVAHSLRVIGDAHAALVGLIDMESGYRGFMLAGADDFLEPYRSG